MNEEGKKIDVYWDRTGEYAVVIANDKAYKYKTEYKPHMTTSKYLQEAAELFKENKDLFERYEGETKI